MSNVMEFLRPDGKKLPYSQTRYSQYCTLMKLWKYEPGAIISIASSIKNNNEDYLAYPDPKFKRVYKELRDAGLFRIFITATGFFSSEAEIRLNDKEFLNFVFSKDAPSTAPELASLKLKRTLTTGNGKTITKVDKIELKENLLDKVAGVCCR